MLHIRLIEKSCRIDIFATGSRIFFSKFPEHLYEAQSSWQGSNSVLVEPAPCCDEIRWRRGPAQGSASGIFIILSRIDFLGRFFLDIMIFNWFSAPGRSRGKEFLEKGNSEPNKAEIQLNSGSFSRLGKIVLDPIRV